MLNKIFNSLDLVVHILIVIAGIWIVFYAFDRALPSFLGTELFINLYSSLHITISLLAGLIIFLTFLYAVINLLES